MSKADEMLPAVGGQGLLFPENPRELCRKLALNWWAVGRLHEDGLLSFDPAKVQDLDKGREAEIRFLDGLRAVSTYLRQMPDVANGRKYD